MRSTLVTATTVLNADLGGGVVVILAGKRKLQDIYLE